MTIKIWCNAFPNALIINDIDVSTFSFYGPTNGYNRSDNEGCSNIGFVTENAYEVVKAIQSTFHLNPEYSKAEDYIWIKDKFNDYEQDKRPIIKIRLTSGVRGLINPPQFQITNGGEG